MGRSKLTVGMAVLAVAVVTVLVPPHARAGKARYLTSVVLSPTSVVGGTSATGTVTLNGGAPSGGATVTLFSDNPTVATVPASVMIQARKSSATFTVATHTVTPAAAVSLSASFGGTLAATLTVLPPDPPALPSPPAAPSSLTVGAISLSEGRLSWSDNSASEASFEIERKTGSEAFGRIATVGANTTGFTDSGLNTSALYTYRVRAINGAGASAYSNEAALTITGGAAAWCVAPNGTPRGQGTLAAPWDLATALAGGPRGTEVKPGDTIWVRGGTYSGTFSSQLFGTAAAPIIVRNYQGERAIIDQAGASGPGLAVPSADVWFWGLEFTNSETTRVTTVSGSDPPINRGLYDNLLQVVGPNVKLINCIIHDGGNGIGMWEGAKNGEIYGCLSFNNGWYGADRGAGHGIYTQNVHTDAVPSQRKIRDTIVWNNFGYGVHAYGAAGHVQNMLCEGFVGFNTSAPAAAYSGSTERKLNLLVSSDQPCKLLTVRGCYLYHPATGSARNLAVGDPGTNNEDVTLQDNYIAGGTEAAQISGWQSASVTGNTMMARGSGKLCTVQTYDGTTPTGYTWNNNTYYDATNLTGGLHRSFMCSGVTEGGNTLLTYSGWKSGTGFDASSSYSEGAPLANRIFVEPNDYEPGRAHVIVYNWEGLSAVTVNLSGVGLVNGQGFEIRNVQNYFGMPVLVGTYDTAHPMVSLPLTDATVTSPIGFESYPIPSTLPEFGVFVVLPIATP